MFTLRRSEKNPLLVPRPDVNWDKFASFNPSVVKNGKTIHCVYRALGTPHLIVPGMHEMSTIGYTTSTDGENFGKRYQIFSPEYDWEKYGCEDPRIVLFEGVYFIFYTALSTFPYGASGIKTAVALTKDFKTFEKHPVTPFNAKAMTIFPKRVNGKIIAVFSLHTDMPPAHMAFAELDKIEDLWSKEYWDKWYANWREQVFDFRRNPDDHAEVGAVPVLTDRGWLMIYSHVEKYFTDHKIFGIEAVLLAENDIHTVLGRTNGPIMVPQEVYEKYGMVPNITFPTGAYIEKENLHIYYGGADSVCARATVNLENLIDTMIPSIGNHLVERYEHNPILSPRHDHDWESKAVFNPTAIDIKGNIYILYRAMSSDNTSTVGMAVSKDGINIDERLSHPIYIPREDFEMKKIENGNSGCEDARIVLIGKTLYMTYTAYNGIDIPRVAVTYITLENFLKRNWHEWSKPIIISPDNLDDKDSTILPEPYKNHYMFVHRIGLNICADFLTSLDFSKNKAKKCIELMQPRPMMWDGKKLGIAGPPIKTKKGWLWLYHGISETSTYRLGAALFDLEDPTKLISRLSDPILSPERDYELNGQVNKVVFPCGAIVRGDTLFIYYGGGDSVTGVATCSVKYLLNSLLK